MFAYVLALVAATWSVDSRADLVVGGFSGTIFSGSDFGSDPGGFFGLGFDLDDQPITGTFRYDTAEVPPPSSVGPNSATYSDPTFSTDFLEISITINGRSYIFGGLAGPPGIQFIDVIDNTDQLQIDYGRFGPSGSSEEISLRFISDIDFLTGIGVPTHFDFVASGVGLNPSGAFAFDLPNGDFADAQFTIETGFARVSEPATMSIVALGLVALFGLHRRRVH